jgi:membrane protease YdiL (CAAX protease family)
MTTASGSRSPLRFFLLVFALSVPFALIGAATGVQLSPGIQVSALGFVCPATAAAMLVYRGSATAGVKALLRRAVDYDRIGAKRWYAPILLLMPAVAIATYGLMRLTGSPLPGPRFSVVATPVMLLAFFIAALGEELGWSGYAIDAMQERWSPLQAGVLLGVIWAIWHIVAMVQAGQSPAWIAWGCLDMVGTRVLMVWLYNNTGRSVFAIALYHAMANLSAKTMFPGGSYHAERVMSLLIVGTAAFVAVARGLARRPSESPTKSTPRGYVAG